MAFGDVLWTPDDELVANSNLLDYLTWVKKEYNLDLSDYSELYEWSITNIEDFWVSMLDYNEVQYSGEYNHVMSQKQMPGVKWFDGVKINYAEHILNRANDNHPAIISFSEHRERRAIEWSEVIQKVKNYQSLFLESGVLPGDAIVAFVPNCEETTYAFLAASSLGAIWSSCSPDFGVKSVLDRFTQIEPKVFIACDGYKYGGKSYSKTEVSYEILQNLPTVKLAVMIDFLQEEEIHETFQLTSRIKKFNGELKINRVDFNDPIWVLYSSGTTGQPKAITHSHGGVLLEHLKYIKLHNDVHPGEKFYWYTTTGWMMWNFLHGALLGGATIVLYDGSPGFGGIDMLWKMASEIGLEHFGTSAPFIVACMQKKLNIANMYDLSKLRTIGSTGAPLPPEAFDYVYASIDSDVWLCSMAGGTDVCTAWVGSNPLLPVKAGEIQCRTLGTDMEAWDENGKAVIGDVGEMIVKQAMPSMPIYFWNDADMERYKKSYFETYTGKWRHGDWIKIQPDGQVIIYGRSDATLNRQGVRIGTAEIYRNIHDIIEIEDSIIINIERQNGEHFMPLFVQLKEDIKLTDALCKQIKSNLRKRCTPRHVPDDIIQVPDIPRTISGKKMEAPLKKILIGMTNKDKFNRDAMKNPESMDWFFEYRKTLKL